MKFQTREIVPHLNSVGNVISHCRLIYGDNLEVMEKLIDEGMENRINAIYIDPPFFTGETFNTIQKYWDDSNSAKNIQFIEQRAYDDHWNRDLETYCSMMYPRLQQIYRLLSSDGAFFLHCDQNASHYLKVMCDEIFDRSNFRNEIIISRIQKNIREHQTVPRLNNAYDSILFYAKSSALRITPPPLERKKAIWHAFDAPNLRKNLTYPIFGVYPPPGRHWMWNEEDTKIAISEKRIRKTKTGSIQYLIGPRTTFRDNIWTDLTAYSFNYEYPTEKKEIIINTLLSMLPMEKGIIADFFCGSGTTLAVAGALGWQWIGCDSSPQAIHVCKKRLIDLLSKGVSSQEFQVQILISSTEPTKNKSPLSEFQFKIGQIHLINESPDHIEIQILISEITHQNFPIEDPNQLGRLLTAWRDNFMTIIDLIEIDWGPITDIFHSRIRILAGFGKDRILLPSKIECKIPSTNVSQIRIRLTDLFGAIAEQTINLPSLRPIVD